MPEHRDRLVERLRQNEFAGLAELETGAAIHLAFVEQLIGLRG